MAFMVYNIKNSSYLENLITITHILRVSGGWYSTVFFHKITAQAKATGNAGLFICIMQRTKPAMLL